jgi:SAM-dependent methyltransferase
MKLSDLVAFNHSLRDLSISESQKSLSGEVNTIIGKIKNSTFGNYDRLVDLQKELFDKIEEFNHELSEYKESLNKYQQQAEIPYFSKSYEIYEEMSNDSPEYILSRSNAYSIDNSDEFKERINLYASWKHAGLYIRPGHDSYIDQMISNDPLYVADTHQDLLEPVKKRWTPDYQARVRYKIINDSSEKIFKDIPTSQLGLIVVSNFFNFKPFEVIKKYLLEFNQILKPGGVVIFTYNNCDYPGAVRNVESHFNCYTPGRIIKDFVESLEFEILNNKTSASGLNWIEIKKPGVLVSQRGGQELSKIIKTEADII